jgi:hypothetical protein
LQQINQGSGDQVLRRGLQACFAALFLTRQQINRI